jgi:hypothetical protein
MSGASLAFAEAFAGLSVGACRFASFPGFLLARALALRAARRAA